MAAITDPQALAVGRAMAREDFYFFVRWMHLQTRKMRWLRARHHAVICNALMRVYRCELKRLIINIPPRYSKTELAVIYFIAWAIGKAPDSEFIHASYSATLAANNTSRIRDIVQSEEYRAIFPEMVLKMDSQAKDHWKTTDGGVVYATGADGTITGFGAGKVRDGFGGILSIDDPTSANDAHSEVMLKKAITWYQNAAESRLNNPQVTAVVLIMQRINEMDLAGWLKDGGTGEDWEVISLPALQDDGSALWPEKHTVEDLKRMQMTKPMAFASQYQQQPSPIEGAIFQPDKIETWTAIPAGTEFIRAWDLASTQDDGDWTAGLKLGKMPDGRFMIADVARFQGRPETVEAGIKNAAGRDGHGVTVGLPQDPGQAGKAQIAYLTKQLAGYTVKSSPESGDKITRAEPFASQVNVGNVVMLRAPWNDALIAELRVFPNGKFDDQVDAASRAFNALVEAGDWSFTSI